MNNLKSTRFKNHLKLNYLKNDELIGGEVARTGSYEQFETELLLNKLKKGDVAVDIGANIGIYALQMACKVGSAGQIFAFEPELTNFQILTKNVQENGLDNVTAFPVALSDKKGISKLFLSWDNLGDHRIYDAGYRRKRIFTEVATDKLDNLLLKKPDNKRIKVIKIDTQGFEPYVLKGAQEVVKGDQPVIFLEFWPFGYIKSGADKTWMLDFLLKIYPKILMIDEKNKKVLPVRRENLEDFTNLPGEAEGYRNLVFGL